MDGVQAFIFKTGQTGVTDTFLLTFFFFARELRDRSLERDREVSRTECVCGLVARPDVGFVWAIWPERCHFLSFFVCYLGLCNVNWKTLTVYR